ncbi:luciferase [Lentzea pudingi]|uniref:Luciferase n=1 Tax=Lentzea pudingi TaxID=1789439 RepID=A0ABQ2HYZ4_9PSEU|nr:LLM class flavin-dependent oxidoreductase [Lentzea pudingi]GGM94914.1 luciferase [Lentzea pudingi]
MTTRTPVAESPLLSGPHRLKLATFGFNAQGGTTITSAEGPPDTDWDQQVRIAQLSEAAGIEAVLPGARWLGYGGRTNFQGRSYDTFAWAAAIAAVTTRCQVFATFHLPTAHPVRVAKTIATIDHVSGGRFGLNIVAGWNVDELSMFGLTQRDHDERYDFGDDYLAVLNQLLDHDGFFDHTGPYFELKRGYSEPKPLQSPRPVYMAAGLSPRGRRFAAQHADISFMAVQDVSKIAPAIAQTKQEARDFGRDLMVFVQTPIVCADTEKEAQELLGHYVDEMGDFEAARNMVSSLFGNTLDTTGAQRDVPVEEGVRAFLRLAVAGHGAAPLIGTPEQIVDALLVRAEAGIDGVTLSWLNYEEGLVQFQEKILPLLVQAGLRVDEDLPASSPEPVR